MQSTPADAISNVGGRGYPRPQLFRDTWSSLDGAWDFAIDWDRKWERPSEATWDRVITVPFAPETERSGIHDAGMYRATWYRRWFAAPLLGPNERLVMHFGAVDYAATVWVNGSLAVSHIGGYTPFSADITHLLVEHPEQEVVVWADDDPNDLAKPRGKQDWRPTPHSIWYQRTSGIWQTVWLERLPASWINRLRWTPSLRNWEIDFEAHVSGRTTNGHRLQLRLTVGDQLLAQDTYEVTASVVHRRIGLPDPGIDDSRNELLWSPSSPTLIEAEIDLLDSNGQHVDRITSYTALRSVAVEGDNFILNGRPYPLRMVLDQGYWVETGLTAPDDAALKRDVELAKSMGFNGVRKHQKIEDPRYLYWADRLGLLVWEEMPSAYRFVKESIERVTREWIDAVDRDINHPCIIAWVPFNESWGVPNLPDNPAERSYVQALYHLTKTIDSSRPVIGNDGWESVATDIIGIHDYDDDPERLARRYRSEDIRPRLYKRERPGGRLLVVGTPPEIDNPVVLSEFGGLTSSGVIGDWGYARVESDEELARRFAELLDAVRSIELFSGFCYTQFADTYQEANGLLRMDRTPKFPIEQIAAAVRGPQFSRYRPRRLQPSSQPNSSGK